MKLSEKLFDYLQTVAKPLPSKESEKELVGCKIVGVDFVTEGISQNSPAVSMLLYLERQDGTKFQLDCSAMVWDEEYQDYFNCAHILLGKSEFPEEVM